MSTGASSGSGSRSAPGATAIAPDGRGRTLVAFQRDTAFDFRPAAIRRYGRRGRLDRGFGDGGRALIPPPRRRWEGTQIHTIHVDGHGRIVLAGRIETGIWVDRETIWHALIARLHG